MSPSERANFKSLSMNIDKRIKEKIDFEPHLNQKKILKSTATDIVICAGRRFGKSMLSAFVALLTLLEGDLKGEPKKIWIVSPTYDLSKKVFDYLVKWFLKVSPSQKKGISYRPFPQIKTARGSIVQCKSAENPSGLLGEELDLLIVDECSRIKREVYESYLYPTTISREGCRTFFISTPFGKNWFYEKWVRAKEEEDGAAFRFTSKDNPHLPEGFWERSRKKIPADVFEQEFQATFKEEMSSVFRNIRNCIADTLKKPQKGHRYIMGLDLAKFKDFTVITIVDKSTHEVVHWDRFQKIPYTLQKQRIIDAAVGYNNARIVIDSNNVGASLGDDLRAHGMRVEDFKSTGTISKDWRKRGSKERLIEKLSQSLEEKNILIPPKEVLIDELESFGYQMTDAGNLRYGAPEGLFDDCVDSLALANWNLHGKKKTENIRAKRSIPSKKKKFQYV